MAQGHWCSLPGDGGDVESVNHLVQDLALTRGQIVALGKTEGCVSHKQTVLPTAYDDGMYVAHGTLLMSCAKTGRPHHAMQMPLIERVLRPLRG